MTAQKTAASACCGAKRDRPALHRMTRLSLLQNHRSPQTLDPLNQTQHSVFAWSASVAARRCSDSRFVESLETETTRKQQQQQQQQKEEEEEEEEEEAVVSALLTAACSRLVASRPLPSPPPLLSCVRFHGQPGPQAVAAVVLA